MVIDIDQLRQADKRPSTFFRPQLEDAGYDPGAGRPLDWQEVGRESWQWHQREKAGMMIARPVPSDLLPEGPPVDSSFVEDSQAAPTSTSPTSTSPTSTSNEDAE